jgi:putative ubiquitin-RnfH superfamily antitoxin RatB of RatAB toxin-antitoxin module
MRIEVAYATPAQQRIIAIDLEEGVTAGEAISRSGIEALFPECDLSEAPVGIFGKPCERNTPLREGDRVEIYRPLLVDPKLARRLRARK